MPPRLAPTRRRAGRTVQLIFSGVTAAVAALAAWFTLIRHFGQTDADYQRRITESFSKAVEQLGSDKLEVRLGGIYALRPTAGPRRRAAQDGDRSRRSYPRRLHRLHYRGDRRADRDLAGRRRAA